MVIGNGLIAKRFMKTFENDSSVIIFASGVSNSMETSDIEYIKEKKLLEDCIKKNENKKIIYFSSIMHLNGVRSKYMSHKIEMELYIQNFAKNYLIARLPQLIGNGGNKNNIINHFNYCIKNNITINIQSDTFRSIIDIDHIFDIINKYLFVSSKNDIIDISYIEKITILDLASIMYNIHNINKNIILVKKGHSIETKNSPIVDDIISNLSINKKNYTENCIKKYINL